MTFSLAKPFIDRVTWLDAVIPSKRAAEASAEQMMNRNDCYFVSKVRSKYLPTDSAVLVMKRFL